MSPRPPIITFLPLPDARANRRVPSVVSDVVEIIAIGLLAFVLFVDCWLMLAL